MAILTAGQRLGAYTIADRLGVGGMAEVYRATHQVLERTVAIKVINPAFNMDPTFPLRFLREAKAVARLSHPNIITVYDFGEQGPIAYLVMEIADGGTFSDRAAQLTTLAQAVDELAPIAAALGYAHAKGIVHRDLKPLNLLVGEQRQLLLADFGLARVASDSLDLDLTTSGMIMGTPYYLAPEQVRGDDIDHRADLYAFGILTFEALAGKRPYQGRTALAIMEQHLTSPPPSIQSVIPEAPARLEAAIARATAKQPGDRFTSVADFLNELREAAQQAPDLPIGKALVPGSAPGSAESPSAAARTDRPTLPLPHASSPASNQGTSGIQASGEAASVAPDSQADGASMWIPPAAVAAAFAAPDAGPATMTHADPGAAHTSHGNHPGRAVRVKRRVSSFNELQWLTIGTVLLVVLFINGVGLWLTRAGLAANRGNVLEGINSYIYQHLGAFKSVLTGLALVLAGLAVFSMRAAIVDNHDLSAHLYRRLRRYHRLAGYSAIVVALAVGLLTCAGIFGFGTASPRAALHSVLGIALVVLIGAKLAVVRYFPEQRRHLKLLGEALLVAFILVFATSTVPYVWSHISGTSHSNPYNPYIGQILP